MPMLAGRLSTAQPGHLLRQILMCNTFLHAMLTALLQADAAPSKASHLLITIHRCQGLVLQSAHNGHDKMPGIAAAVQRPYIHYTPPGRNVGHDSGVGEGDAPIYNDAACWAYVRSKKFEQALHEQSLQVRLHCLLHHWIPKSSLNYYLTRWK